MSDKLKHQPSQSSLRHMALSFLARREHSRYELSRKLVQRGASMQQAEFLLEELVALDLQSDLRFVEMLIRSRLSRGMGPIRARSELLRKGIDPQLVARMVSDVDWSEALSSCWQKKFNGQNPVSPAEYAKQKRFLLQRGFEMEAILQLRLYHF